MNANNRIDDDDDVGNAAAAVAVDDDDENEIFGYNFLLCKQQKLSSMSLLTLALIVV